MFGVSVRKIFKQLIVMLELNKLFKLLKVNYKRVHILKKQVFDQLIKFQGTRSNNSCSRKFKKSNSMIIYGNFGDGISIIIFVCFCRLLR